MSRTVPNQATANDALIDSNGRILAVNRNWSNFGRANGLELINDGIGVSYLDFCSGPEGSRVRFKLEQLLSGASRSVAEFYHCHSAEERRWCCMIAHATPGFGSVGFVVSHLDISRIVFEAGWGDLRD